MTASDPRRAPLRELLVPTDFSRGAELALERALLLPLAAGGRLHLVHVLLPGLPAKVRPKVTAAAEHALGELVARVGREVAGRDVKVTSEVRSGVPFVEIIRRSRALGTELIVLGRHGRRAIRDMFIGTTAERVIRKGEVPVLVVNLKPTHPYRRPLVASDLDDASRRAFELAFRVLGPAVNHINVVHAYNVPFEGLVTPAFSVREKSDYRKSLREQAVLGLTRFLKRYQGVGVRWKTTLGPGDARSMILDEAARRRADLVALATHGRSGAAHALVGSVAEWVIAAAPCDVLVARPGRVSLKVP